MWYATLVDGFHADGDDTDGEREKNRGPVAGCCGDLNGTFFAKLANTTKRRVNEFTRARVNSLTTCLRARHDSR